MKPIYTTFGQSLSDIAIQEYGCIEGCMALIIDNDFIGNLDVVFEPNTRLNIREEKIEFTDENVAIMQIMVLEKIGKIVGGLPTNMIINMDYVEVDYVEVDYVF